MAFMLGLLLGLMLGVVLMFFIWAACNDTRNREAEKTGMINLGNEFYYIVKIKEENKNEQN